MHKQYYKIDRYHKEIFGFEDSCSYHELLFITEAPKELSGIDIWKYVTYVPLKECNHYSDKISTHPYYVLTKKELEEYPYYEMFISMYLGNHMSPLIFMKNKDGLVCIEGRHRVRLAQMFNTRGITLDNLPAIIVKYCDTRDAPRYPKNYEKWIDLVNTNSWRYKFKKAREAFERLKWD